MLERITTREVGPSVLTSLAVLAMTAITGLGDRMPMNGRTSFAIATHFHNRFLPAEYALKLRGFVLIGLIAYAVMQVLPVHRRAPRYRALYVPLWAAAIAHIVQVVSFHSEAYTLSLLAMFALVGSLVPVYRTLQQNAREATLPEVFAVQIPLRAYLAWASVMTLVRFSETMEAWGFAATVQHPAAWAATMAFLATGVALAVGWMRRDPVYLAVVAWLLAGVAVTNRDARAVFAMAVAGAVLLVLALLRAVFVNKGHLAGPPLRPAHMPR